MGGRPLCTRQEGGHLIVIINLNFQTNGETGKQNGESIYGVIIHRGINAVSAVNADGSHLYARQTPRREV